MKQKVILTLLATLIFLAACSPGDGSTAAETTYTDVSVADFQGMLDDKDFVFVNVHIPFEGDLPETDLSIAFDEIDQNLDQLPADKDAKIVLYCRSGNMSSQAAKTLADLGYTNVWNLEGGFNAWKAAGLPLAEE